MYYIYLIRKQGIPVYVGFTSKTIEERWKSHITESKKQNNKILYNSMRKNGIDCFTIEQLYESEDFEHTLNYMEHHFIWLYKTYYEYGGYNMTLGGEGTIKLGTLSSKEYNKEYYQKNKEKFNEYIKKYYEQNKDKINEQRKKNYQKNKDKTQEYYQKNKDKTQEYYQKNKEKKKEYYQKNKEKKKEYKKEYYQKNKDKLNEQKRLKRKLKKSAQDQPMQTLYV